MHSEAYQFVAGVSAALELKKLSVVEFGSLVVNTSVRPLFKEAAHYTGVDQRKGKGVDVVSRAQDYDPDKPADVVICCETLEHEADPESIIAAAERILKPGGILILTAAAPERRPHSMDGHTVIPAGEPYGNIEPAALERWLKAWTQVRVIHNPAAGDVYAVARTRTPTPKKES